MRIRKRVPLLSATGMALILAMQPASAFDPDKVFGADAGARHILKYGFDALRDGRHDDALGAFRHGAEQEHVASQWKLARMLESGVGVQRDQLAAYRLYERIAERFNDLPPNRIDRPYVANSVVSLGRYALTGIEGTEVAADPRVAEFHFYRAAALYGDAEAQFQLGQLYNSAQLGTARPRTAARWYKLASRKGHPKAQAELGNMLFHGEGIRPNRVKGLAYLMYAARQSAKSGFQRIRDLRRDAFAKASQAQRDAAARFVARLSPGIAAEAATEITGQGLAEQPSNKTVNR